MTRSSECKNGCKLQPFFVETSVSKSRPRRARLSISTTVLMTGGFGKGLLAGGTLYMSAKATIFSFGRYITSMSSACGRPWM